jgi:murein DD-endopeptidase MepM/ murein hydrolase activator NlpD
VSKTKKWGGTRRAARVVRVVSLLVAAVCLAASVTVSAPSLRAYSATSMADLEKQLQEIEQQKAQHKADLADAKKSVEAAAALQSSIKQEISVLQSQIAVLKSEIATVQNNIGLKEQEIAEKEEEIDQKQAEIDEEWDTFKQRVAAMQELREGGSVAMLSAVTDLYQLLTFSEVMQEISVRDTEIMDEMKQAKDALEQAKTELEAEKEELLEQKNELDEKNSQMSSKQSSLNSSLSEANLSYEEAKSAQSEAQAALDSDEMNYESVQKEIQKLIAAAAAAQSKLTFTGFICPLKTYSRISSEYGYRTNPVSGVYKLHGGIDFAAPKGTPIYAAASGYVTVAGWNSSGYGNYVIIYHGEMSDGVAYSTLYAHMSSIAVTQGTAVAQGQVIGYVGSTGNSTGYHLHLEVWQGRSSASRVDPRKYVPIS